MTEFKDFCAKLETAIRDSYTNGVTMEEAEKLAGKFLGGQLAVSTQLKAVSLDARMRKSGLKAMRAAIYLGEIKGADKKPTEAQLAALVDTHEVVQSEQNALDTAEVEREALERYYDVFGNAHIHFRSIAKGSFGV